MNNKVKFLRGTSDEYAVAEKDSDTIYFTTDDGKLYIGDKEVSGSDITIDDTLSDTSENPVQNKIINAALNEKASKDTMTGATSTSDGTLGLVPAPVAGENEKFLRGDGTWQEVSGGSGAVISATAPDDTTVLWIDTGNGGIVKYHNGIEWIATASTWG